MLWKHSRKASLQNRIATVINSKSHRTWAIKSTNTYKNDDYGAQFHYVHLDNGLRLGDRSVMFCRKAAHTDKCFLLISNHLSSFGLNSSFRLSFHTETSQIDFVSQSTAIL